jgi:hypothetical protein
MRLIRGNRYGLCGPNGVGKSTLMRAIANGQVDGFPPADELRTVYVEHDIQVGFVFTLGSRQQQCNRAWHCAEQRGGVLQGVDVLRGSMGVVQTCNLLVATALQRRWSFCSGCACKRNFTVSELMLLFCFRRLPWQT